MTIDTAALRELCKRATPGPWKHWPLLSGSENHRGYKVAADTQVAEVFPLDQDGTEGGHNAAFIAAARTALPELLDRVEALEKVADEASELLAACGALRHLGRLTNKDTGKRLVEVRAHKDVADFVEANYADIDFFIQKLQNALHDAGYGG